VVVELGAEEEEEEEEVGGVGGACLAMCLGIATTGATREPGWEIELPLGGLTSGVIGLFSILSSW